MSKKTIPSPFPEDEGKPRPKKKKEFHLWPPSRNPDIPRGPTEKQKLLFIEELPIEQRPHLHEIDCVLYIGGRRAGKSAGTAARVISYLMKNPGTTAVIGATNFPLLQRSVLDIWANLFKVTVPWDMARLKGYPIIKKPTQVEKYVQFRNGSKAIFMHLEKPEVLRGMDLSIIHFEEACLLEDSSAFRELVLSLSGKGKPRQLILTTNPNPRGGWLDDLFKLEQLRPTYTGAIEPICEPCICHKCEDCINSKRCGKDDAPEFVDGICPVCETTKRTSCPGNQVWMRVIQTSTFDNQHNPSDLVQSMKSTLDEKNFNIFVEGSTEDIRDGYLYKSFTDKNIIKKETCGIAIDRPLIWTLDFNYEPQSSIILQENMTTSGFSINVLDELIIWNALPQTAAEEFCKHPDVVKWQEATEGSQPVLVYGDPSGLYGTGPGLMPSYYQIIYNVLEKAGFDCRIMMRKPPTGTEGGVLKEPVKIPVAGRVDALNEMLNKDGHLRIFINERCKNLIKSLRELRYADDGINIDKSCDRRAKRDTDKSKPFCMTHPADALGYYVYKRFPVIKNKAGFQFFQIPGSPMIEVTGKTIQERRVDETRKALREEREQARAERRAKRKQEREKKSDTFGGWLRSFGLLP